MTDIAFGDKMGSKVMTLKPFSYLSWYISHSHTCRVLLLYYFHFERVLIMRVTYKVFQEYMNLVSFSVWPFVSLSIRPSVRPFVNF